MAYENPDSDKEVFDAYDLRVRQPIPFILTISNGGRDRGEVKVVCVAPDEVVGDSRSPDSSFPPEPSGAISLQKINYGMLMVVLGGMLFNGAL